MSSTPRATASTLPDLVLLQSNNTYEASQEGFLALVAYELLVAEWGSALKDTMKHITYAPEYDGFDKSGIFDFFEINNRTVQSRKSPRLKLRLHALTTSSRGI
jgi:hypothetical protein